MDILIITLIAPEIGLAVGYWSWLLAGFAYHFF
jgi:hypothetical protein